MRSKYIEVHPIMNDKLDDETEVCADQFVCQLKVTTATNQSGKAQSAKGFLDIISCDKTKYLFVTIYDRPFINSIDPTTKQTINSWEVSDGEPWGLSLTLNRNVLVSCNNVGQLREYSPCGDLIRKIEVDSIEDGPWHGIQIDEMHWVVIHGERYGVVGSTYTEIRMVDYNGHAAAGYTAYRGNGFSYISYDPICKQFLIAEMGGGRILLLDRHLNLIQPLLTPDHGIKKPIRMHMYKQYLLVGLQTGTLMEVEILPIAGSPGRQYFIHAIPLTTCN